MTTHELKNAPQHDHYPYDILEVGGHCHVMRHTDIEPATVVATRRGGKEVTVQIDSYKLAVGEKPQMVAGGFAAHCTNHRDLKYDIRRNEQGHLETYTLRKWRGRYCWTPKGGAPNGHQHLRSGWVAFYDYNF